MPGIISQYLNQLQDYFANPEAEKKLKGLLSEEEKRTPSWFKALQSTFPMGGAQVGLTRQEMARPVLAKLFQGRKAGQLTSAHRKELANALRIIAKAPRRVVQELSELTFPGNYWEMNPEKVGGAFQWRHPSGRPLSIPTETSINLYSQPKSAHALTSVLTPATTLAHEVGHGVATRIGQRLPGSDPLKTSFFETIRSHEWEGVAEYLGQKISEAANVSREPVLAYGQRQAESLKELSQMPSKNPYMNVYRYLRSLLGK